MIKELEKAIMVLKSIANQHYHLMPITAQEAIEELTVLKQQNLHPQPCTPLSDEEILAIAKEQAMKLPNPNIDIDFARAIERAHGITNGHKH